jgi:glucose/arabinose dehydrogenase
MLTESKPKIIVVLLAITFLINSGIFAQTPDLEWFFGNVGSSSYTLESFSPRDAEFGPLGSQDPTLPLVLGKRYQVVVVNYSHHPFEVIAKADSPGQDRVLLSMAIAGSFQADPQVNWQDDGRGTVQFTLTGDLYQAMLQDDRIPGYRCRPHLFQMRGDFTVGGFPIAEPIRPSSVRIDLKPIATELTAPVDLQPDPTLPNRLYIVDQAGVISVLEQGQLWETPFLDLRDRLVSPLGFFGTFDENDFDERGLLGLAFHPGYADPQSPGYGALYTYTSQTVDGPADFSTELPLDEVNHQSVVTQWQVTEERSTVNPDSAREVLRIDEPQFNHDGGQITFGPDGYLYIALGDGGSANDDAPGHGTTGNGQNIHTVLGSILRIDPIDPGLTMDSPDPVSANGSYRVPSDNPFVGTEGVDEIYAYGLRNPYRFSFDRQSGILIVADVGQGFVEEINIVHKGGNYGWKIKEGDFLFDPDGVVSDQPFEDPDLIDPVVQYDHDEGLSVIGGFIYYGSQFPQLYGQYVFGDFSRAFSTPDGRLLVADLWTGDIRELLIGHAQENLNLFVKGFGQDQAGEIYLLASTALGPFGSSGGVFKLVPPPTQFTATLSAGPASTDSLATGQLRLTLDPDHSQFTYHLAVHGIDKATIAYLDIADTPEGPGLPAVWLYPTTPPQPDAGLFNTPLATGQIRETNLIGPLTRKSLLDLVDAIQQGRAYVTVHSEQYPNGEIRGQLK